MLKYKYSTKQAMHIAIQQSAFTSSSSKCLRALCSPGPLHRHASEQNYLAGLLHSVLPHSKYEGYDPVLDPFHVLLVVLSVLVETFLFIPAGAVYQEDCKEGGVE